MIPLPYTQTASSEHFVHECRRLAVDAAESQGVKRRRSQLDVDKAFASVF